jgi:hypothetical protein
MWEFLSTPVAQAVVWVAVTLVVSIVAWYGLEKFRDRAKDEVTASDHLTKFRELRQRGVLTDAEFRTIKTVLGQMLQDEASRDNDQG